MKTKQLQLIAACLSAGAISAPALADAPKFYGKANVSFQQIEEDQAGTTAKDQWELKSNASRLGVKGSQAINEKLTAIYKAEFEIAIDDGDTSDDNAFKQRNIYVGLQGDFGKVIAGKHDTPMKLAGKAVDRFNDLELGDIKNTMTGENREDNILIYTSPKFNNFTATIALRPGEEDNGNDEDGVADGTSISVNYKADNISITLANDTNIQNTDTTRLVGEYTMGDYKFGALYQVAEETDTGDGVKLSSIGDDVADTLGNVTEQTAYLISGQAKVADFVLKAQYSFSENEFEANIDDMEITQLALGADYPLTKTAKVYGYYSMVEAENNLGDFDYNTLAIGFELKF